MVFAVKSLRSERADNGIREGLVVLDLVRLREDVTFAHFFPVRDLLLDAVTLRRLSPRQDNRSCN